MQDQEQETRPLPGPAIAQDALTAMMQGAATSIEVYLHRNFGRRALGGNVVRAILLMVLFIVCARRAHRLPLECFLYGFVVLSMFAGIGICIRMWRGHPPMHTRYNGTPHVMWLVPRWNEVTVKRLEGLLVFAIGYGVIHFNRPLGFYLMTAAACFWLTMHGAAVAQRNKALDMNDAVIEQTIGAERFREMQRR